MVCVILPNHSKSESGDLHLVLVLRLFPTFYCAVFILQELGNMVVCHTNVSFVKLLMYVCMYVCMYVM